MGSKIARVILGVCKLAVTMAMADYSESYSSEIEFKVLITCLVKGYQECVFKVGTGDIYFLLSRRSGIMGVH